LIAAPAALPELPASRLCSHDLQLLPFDNLLVMEVPLILSQSCLNFKKLSSLIIYSLILKKKSLNGSSPFQLH
jgi:hypothetical protein